ncbi:uncharacterized protein LOC134250255 [Saccostrea cucullata]|uniref:uncharacterized protein LOC134250255 n=1 Tax=Saccostrea cuccullata TaxID=36930 RepID=UPI002ED690F4
MWLHNGLVLSAVATWATTRGRGTLDQGSVWGNVVSWICQHCRRLRRFGLAWDVEDVGAFSARAGETFREKLRDPERRGRYHELLVYLLAIFEMDLLKELTAYGQSLELTGADLQRFIREQQAHLRELRVEQRERQKEDRDYELKREALELSLKETESKGAKSVISDGSLAKFPKMPYFDEVKDDIDSFLRRFERYAIAQKWNEGMWAVNLSALLKGRALDVYALLPQEKALDYAVLKTTLLRRFEKTEDGFREYSKKETIFENRNPVAARDQRNQKEQVPPKTNGQSFSQKKKTGKDIRCYKCSRLGHIASQCKQSSSKNQSFAVKADASSESGSNLKETTDSGKCSAFTSITSTSTFSMANSSDLLTTSACSVANFSDQMPVCVGEINDQSVQVLRDTGCNGVIVRRSLVNDDQLTGDHQVCVLADGSKIETPIAKVNVDTPYFVGEVNAWCLHAPLYPLTIGKIPHARDPHDLNKDWKPSAVNAVVTRQQKRMESKKIKPLSVPEIIGSEVCPEDMLKAQEEDETLKNLRALVGKETNGNRVKYILKKGMLFRVFQSEKVENGKQFTQLVVPKKYRMKVLSLAHESLMAGHSATSRTIDKVLAEFYSPGVQADTRRFCRSCDICHRTTPKGRTTKVPMSVMPIIDEPFRRVAVDLVGPIQPMTDNGNRYILTLVDFSTRYPEGVALIGIETERVAEALVDIFCRIGVLKEMLLTDMGTQFTSELMGEVSRLLSMKQLSTTPYHPMCNGLVERFNGTLKQDSSTTVFRAAKRLGQIPVNSTFCVSRCPTGEFGIFAI